jgi:hypothetical protein
MIMKAMIILILWTLPFEIFCQTTFEKEFGGRLPDYGRSAIEASDKGYIIVGESYSFTNGSKDIYITKTDKRGIKIWDKHYGGKNADYAYDVKLTSDGNYVVIGATDNFGEEETPNIYLLKIDNHGDTLWTKTYGTGFGDYGYSIIESYDKSLVITGMSDRNSNGKKNLIVLKTDKNGNERWLKTYEPEESYIGKCIIQTNDSDYIVLSDKPEYGGQMINSYLKLIKISPSGDTLWTKTIKHQQSFQAANIIQTHDNGFIICGTSSGNSSNKRGATDIYLIKTDNSGNVKWMRSYGGNDYDLGHGVTQASDSDYVIVGETYRNENYNNYKDMVLYKVDNAGSMIWSRTFKSKGIELGNTIIETSDSGLLIGGTLNNNDGLKENDVFLLKVDKDGMLHR